MPKTPTEPQHSVCAACGHRIVQALTSAGVRVALDTGLRAYALCENPDRTWRAESTRAYPVHACRGTKE